MRLQPQMLAFGVRRAEAAKVHALVALHRRAQPPGVRGVSRGCKKFHVAFLEHQADIRGSGGTFLRLLRGGRRHCKTERFQRARRGVQIGNEVRDVVEDQLAGSGNARGHVL